MPSPLLYLLVSPFQRHRRLRTCLSYKLIQRESFNASVKWKKEVFLKKAKKASNSIFLELFHPFQSDVQEQRHSKAVAVKSHPKIRKKRDKEKPIMMLSILSSCPRPIEERSLSKKAANSPFRWPAWLASRAVWRSRWSWGRRRSNRWNSWRSFSRRDANRTDGERWERQSRKSPPWESTTKLSPLKRKYKRAA